MALWNDRVAEPNAGMQVRPWMCHARLLTYSGLEDGAFNNLACVGKRSNNPESRSLHETQSITVAALGAISKPLSKSPT